MKINKKSGSSTFVPHPATTNLTRAVIVDVTPFKRIKNKFAKGKDDLERDIFKLVYESEILKEDGTPFAVWSAPYSPSLHEKSGFAKDLKKILGRNLTKAEEDEFETDNLLGLPVQIIVGHEEVEGDTYARITHIQPDASGNPLKPSGKFIREQDREKQGPDGTAAAYHRAPAAEGGREDWGKVKVHVGPYAGIDLSDIDRKIVLDLYEKFGSKHQERVSGKLLDRKPSADDKRLYAALVEAHEEITKSAALQPQDESAY